MREQETDTCSALRFEIDCSLSPRLGRGDYASPVAGAGSRACLKALAVASSTLVLVLSEAVLVLVIDSQSSDPLEAGGLALCR